MALYKNNLENKEVQILKAIESISKIAKDLNTISYVWGGITTSIHQGFFYRPHHDIDLFIINLHVLADKLKMLLDEKGWVVKKILNNHMLILKNNILKIHINNIIVEDQKIAHFKHNGSNGTITFPLKWLRQKPVTFYNIVINVIEPELLYVLKTNPYLMDPEYRNWDERKKLKREEKDKKDIPILEKMIINEGIDPKILINQVSSY